MKTGRCSFATSYYLLIGRGNSGKTTLAKLLDRFGFDLIGNTHSIIKNGHIWAINSWIRERDHKGNDYYSINNNQEKCRDAKLKKIIVVDYNSERKFKTEKLSKNSARAFISFFGASIINYDLKEDIFDYDNLGEFSDRISFFEKEFCLIESLINEYEIIYVSSDIYSEECVKKIGEIFD